MNFLETLKYQVHEGTQIYSSYHAQTLFLTIRLLAPHNFLLIHFMKVIIFTQNENLQYLPLFIALHIRQSITVHFQKFHLSYLLIKFRPLTLLIFPPYLIVKFKYLYGHLRYIHFLESQFASFALTYTDT